MRFIEILKNSNVEKTNKQPQESIIESKIQVESQAQKPEEILRGAGYKIKLVTPTSFGTQFDLAKKYDDAAIKDLLKDFNIKIKDKSVFIIV